MLSSRVSGVEIQCIGHFKLMFSLLRVDGCASVQQFALEVGTVMTYFQQLHLVSVELRQCQPVFGLLYTIML